VTITVTCYSWAPSSGDHLFTCGTIFWPPQQVGRKTAKAVTWSSPAYLQWVL